MIKISNIDILSKGLDEYGIHSNDRIIDNFMTYKDTLKEWNKKINITSINNDEEIIIKHFLDSISILKSEYISDSKRFIDIGTGGGFPGIPLKIVKDDINITLLDSLKKRVKFLDKVINKLDLKYIEAIHGRAEEMGKNEEYRQQFDIAVSRAVASLNILSEYCLPFVKVGGYFIAMKSTDIEDEIKESESAINTLGGKIVQNKNIKIPCSDIVHKLVIIEKTSDTPSKYPRRPGKPKKKPL